MFYSRNYIKLFIGLILILTLFGCDMLNDFYMDLKPETYYKFSEIGKGKTISLKVADEREETVLGYRGTITTQFLTTETKPAFPIIASNNISESIYKSVSEGLSQLGFSVVSADEFPKIKLEIRLINFRTKSGFIAELQTEVSIKLIFNNNGKIFEKFYKNSYKYDYFPLFKNENEETNINRAVGKVLTDMLQDQELFDLLKSL